MMNRMSLSIELSDKAERYLSALVETGLYGKTINEAAQRLLEEQLWKLIHDGSIKTGMEMQESSDPKCPNCGSPRIHAPDVMSSYDFICEDCERGFNLPVIGVTDAT